MAADQGFLDLLLFLISSVRGSDRVLPALWTPRWTPEFARDLRAKRHRRFAAPNAIDVDPDATPLGADN